MTYCTICIRIVLSFIFSCFMFYGYGQTNNKYTDEGDISGNVYRNKKLGWTIEIPRGWEIVPREMIKTNNDSNSPKHLISFRNPRGLFASTSQPFKEQFSGEYIKHLYTIYNIVYRKFKSTGINVDTTSGKELINGHVFYVLYTTLHSVKGEFILNQIMYSSLIKGYDFSVNINCNNEVDKSIILNAFKHSKFK